jgi:hypothetical protein
MMNLQVILSGLETGFSKKQTTAVECGVKTALFAAGIVAA